jgi:phosphoglycolate phosphatase
MKAEVYPEVMELLSDLRNSAFICIATNKRIDYTIILLEHMGIARMCDFIQGLDMDEKLVKRDLIENCIKASGTKDRSKIVVIGDTETDMMATKECGADFIGVTFGFGFKKGSEVTYGRAVADVRSLREILLG